MFTNCIHCNRTFTAQQELEYLRTGRRIAFDPRRGRLWAICEWCSHWTLAPVEARWEALEELEQRTAKDSRLIAKSSNIALFSAGSIEILRIGIAPFREEAWWRYGRKLLRARTRYLEGMLPRAIIRGVMVLGSLFVPWIDPVIVGQAGSSHAAFGYLAWLGTAKCMRCGGVAQELPFKDWKRLALRLSNSGEISIWIRCMRCRAYSEAGYRLEDIRPEHLLRRVLAYRHVRGASRRQVNRAVEAIEEAGSAEDFLRRIARGRRELGDLDSTTSLALAMALNDALERREATAEIRLLEIQWRDEEEIAGIVDDELTIHPNWQNPPAEPPA